MRITVRVGSILLLFLIVASGEARLDRRKPAPCSMREYNRADDGLASLKNWRNVYWAYEKFGQCDNGGDLAEGYSDAIARLLSEKWEGAAELARFCSRDVGFEKFVLRHVDGLMSLGQARTIRRNAESHCPKGALKLCRQIAGRINAMEPLGR